MEEHHQSQWVFLGRKETSQAGPRTPQHPVPRPWRSREHTLNTLYCIVGTHCNCISERQIFKTKVNKHRPKQSEFKCVKQGRPVLQSKFSPEELKKRDVPSLPQLTMQHPSVGILWLCDAIYWQLSNVWVKIHWQALSKKHGEGTQVISGVFISVHKTCKENYFHISKKRLQAMKNKLKRNQANFFFYSNVEQGR